MLGFGVRKRFWLKIRCRIHKLPVPFYKSFPSFQSRFPHSPAQYFSDSTFFPPQPIEGISLRVEYLVWTDLWMTNKILLVADCFHFKVTHKTFVFSESSSFLEWKPEKRTPAAKKTQDHTYIQVPGIMNYDRRKYRRSVLKSWENRFMHDESLAWLLCRYLQHGWSCWTEGRSISFWSNMRIIRRGIDECNPVNFCSLLGIKKFHKTLYLYFGNSLQE